MSTKIRSSQMAVDGAIDLVSNKIINAADPSNAQDVATKGYVDSIAQGLDIKASVRVASTANVTLTAPGTSIDGITLATDDRVLLKNQTTQSQNGIYLFKGASSSMVRAADFNAATQSNIPGSFIFVEDGTTNSATGWVCTTKKPVTIETTTITFTQFSGAGTYTAGAGLTLSAGQFSVSLKSSGGLSTSGGLGIIAADSTINVSASGIKVSDIPNSIVTPTKLGAVAGNGLTGGNGTAISVLANGNTVDVSASGVKVKAGGITAAEIGSSAVGNGLAGGGGTELSVLPNGNTIDVSASGVKVKFGGITESEISETAIRDGLTGGGGEPISIIPDGQTINVSVNGIKIKPGGVTAVEIGSSALGNGLSGGDGTAIALNPSVVPLLTNMVDGEIPGGTINGTNSAFTLANTPKSGTLKLYLNGIRQSGGGNDYSLTGANISFTTAPKTGDIIQADYIK